MTVLAPGEADCVLIAGMGGNEIMHILDEGLGKCDDYVLIAHRDAPKLRIFLAKRGFRLRADTVVKDGGKFYNVLAAERGEGAVPTGAALWLGGDIPPSADREEYLEYMHGKYAAIAARATDRPSKAAALEVLDAVRKAKEEL